MQTQRFLRIPTLTIAALLMLTAAGGAAAASGDSYSSSAEAFEALKGLEGTWSATVAGDDGDFETSEEFRVSANGTVVMEIMNPGTEHEMINMYHLDGDDLMLTHYCAGGNQPRMKLDTESLAKGRLEFDFLDATNLDPSTEGHIHSAGIALIDENNVAGTWRAWNAGEQVSEMTFTMTRQSAD